MKHAVAMFTVGNVYNRRVDIHSVFDGQRQGGISTPGGTDSIFIFTSDAGQHYGYLADGFKDDGTFWYTGEGQRGDMQMVRGNLAIRDHAQHGKHLLLFEYVAKGHVRYVGEFEYLAHHHTDLPDADGDQRTAIVFELGQVGEQAAQGFPQFGSSSSTIPGKASLAQLRALAILGASTSSDVAIRQAIVRRRAEAIKRYALKRANGICEGCTQAAPFATKSGPFLEVHHVHRLGDGGPDHPGAVIALCPNCHRRVHLSIDGAEFNGNLIERLKVLEGSGS